MTIAVFFVIDKPKLQRIIALIRDDRTAGSRARGGHYLLSWERRSPERLFFANRRQDANRETCPQGIGVPRTAEAGIPATVEEEIVTKCNGLKMPAAEIANVEGKG